MGDDSARSAGKSVGRSAVGDWSSVSGDRESLTRVCGMFIFIHQVSVGRTDKRYDPSRGGNSIMFIQRYSRFIERASDGESTFGEDVSVDHCRPDIAMAE